MASGLCFGKGAILPEPNIRKHPDCLVPPNLGPPMDLAKPASCEVGLQKLVQFAGRAGSALDARAASKIRPARALPL